MKRMKKMKMMKKKKQKSRPDTVLSRLSHKQIAIFNVTGSRRSLRKFRSRKERSAGHRDRRGSSREANRRPVAVNMDREAYFRCCARALFSPIASPLSAPASNTPLSLGPIVCAIFFVARSSGETDRPRKIREREARGRRGSRDYNPAAGAFHAWETMRTGVLRTCGRVAGGCVRFSPLPLSLHPSILPSRLVSVRAVLTHQRRSYRESLARGLVEPNQLAISSSTMYRRNEQETNRFCRFPYIRSAMPIRRARRLISRVSHCGRLQIPWTDRR